MKQPPKLLTIAGSDSGGAAGLQADLKTWTAVRVYGMSVITAVTAQNSLSVNAVQYLSPEFVAAQLTAVLSDYGADGVKTGFIGRAELMPIIATQLKNYAVPHIVIDPVLVNHQGQAMFPPEVAKGYQQQLLPLATLLTPNCREAELLTGLPVTTLAQMETAVRYLHQLGPANVLIKRGMADGQVVDLLFDGREMYHLRSPQIETEHTHGSGDMLSAAICAFLAKGEDMITAVTQAHSLTHSAIINAASWQLAFGHGPLAIYDPLSHN